MRLAAGIHTIAPADEQPEVRTLVNRLSMSPFCRREHGFTLVELVTVVVIIGILAAVAMPRYVSLQREVRIAKLKAARAAVIAASALVHAAVLVRNGVPDPKPCAVGGVADNLPGSTGAPGSVCTEDGLTATVFGYPATTPVPAAAPGNPGIVAAAGLSSTFNPTLADLQKEGYTVVVAGGVTSIQILGAPESANCMFTYTQAPSATVPAAVSVVATIGC